MMNVEINRSIIHVLDTNIATPVLSETVLKLEDDIQELLKAHIKKAFDSDNCKFCSFNESSHFCSLLNEIKGDFIQASRQIANEIFNVMIRNKNIPCADLLIADVRIDGINYLVALKMNYRDGYIHFHNSNDGVHTNTIIKQRTLLPNESNKIEEAFFINCIDNTIILIEKKYEIDGIKDFYLSTYILEASNSKSEKDKFLLIKKAVEQTSKKYSADKSEDSLMPSEVSSILYDEVASDNCIKVDNICKRFAIEFPQAKDEFEELLVSNQIKPTDNVIVHPSIIKKLKKQSLYTTSGVEIKIPVELYQDKEAVEFINNPDGSISVLIKNIKV